MKFGARFMAINSSAAEPQQARDSGMMRSFLLRGIVLALVIAAFMRFGNVNIGAIGQD